MILTEQLRELAEGSIKRHPGEAQTIMKAAIDLLKEESPLSNALKTGDTLPDISLPNVMGKSVQVNELLNDKKVILSFYRGGWCPYCNLELKAYQKILPQIEAKGAIVVAISPEVPDHALTTKEKNELQFEVLSDINNEVAKKMNLLYRLPNALVSLYKKFGIDLVSNQQNDQNSLPIAATYIIAQNGTITYHFLEEDYKLRADPMEVLKHL